MCNLGKVLQISLQPNIKCLRPPARFWLLIVKKDDPGVSCPWISLLDYLRKRFNNFLYTRNGHARSSHYEYRVPCPRSSQLVQVSQRYFPDGLGVRVPPFIVECDVRAEQWNWPAPHAPLHAMLIP